MSAAPTPAEIESAIAELREAMAANPHDAQLHFELAQELLDHADATASEVRSPHEADEAVMLLRRATTLAAGRPAQDRALVHAELARVLCWQRDVRAGFGPDEEPDEEPNQQDEIIEAWRRAVEFADQAGVGDALRHDLTSVMLDVIDLLVIRAARAAADTEGLTDAVDYGTWTKARMDTGDEDRPRLLYLLGMAHSLRHDLAPGAWPRDRADAIDCLSELRALPDLDAESAELATLAYFRLGALRAISFLAHGAGPEVRKAALADLETVLAASPGDAEMADACHFLLAQLHIAESWPVQARLTTAAEHIEELRAHGAAMLPSELTAESALRHLGAISQGGTGGSRLGGLDTLVRMLVQFGSLSRDSSLPAIDAMLSQLDAVPVTADDVDLHGLTTLLRAGLLARRAELTGERTAAAQATDQLAAVLDQLPADHPMLSQVSDLLVMLTRNFGGVRRNDESLPEFVDRLERQLTHLPDNHPLRAAAMIHLSVALVETILNGGSGANFERARRLLTSAYELPAATDRDRSVSLTFLGMTDAISGLLDRDPQRLDLAIDRIKSASGHWPPRHPLHDLNGSFMAGVLGQRFLLTRERESLDAARYFLRERRPLAGHPPAAVGEEMGWVRAASAGLGALMHGMTRLADTADPFDADELSRLERDMMRARAAVPELDGMDKEFRQLRQLMGVFRAASGPDGMDFPSDPAKIAAFLEHVAELESMTADVADDSPDALHARAAAGLAAIGAGFAGRDDAAFTRGIGLLASVCVDPRASDRERVQYLEALGQGLYMRYVRFRRPRDLNNAIDRLEQVTRLARQEPDLADGVSFYLLGEAYATRADRSRGDPRRCVTNGLDALRWRAGDVLLQSGAGRGLVMARAASGEAIDVTRWCLRFDQPEAAVTALELGRGMVLHAATAEASVPAMLRDAGRPDLAGEWELVPDHRPWDDESELPPDDLAWAEVPGDLRRRGLAAIRDSSTATRRLSPPAIGDIADALRSAGARALVYLLPATYHQPGQALLVRLVHEDTVDTVDTGDTGDAVVEHIPLPGLTVATAGRVSAFEAAQRAVRAASDMRERGARLAAWRQSLAELCGWAWTAAMRSVLEHLGAPGRPRRLVLVPVGELGAVPWHAATRPVGRGDMRFACQDAIISYAASARQFVEASRRRRLPLADSAAVVRVGGSGLGSADQELAMIREHCYPGCTYLGEHGHGPVGADELRALLPANDRPGASLLHLGCHAEHADPPLDSSLLLDGMQRLHVRDMLRQARHRPADAPGGLVTLATCVSDLTDNAHDEALTLATAFLAAGAVGVVGTRWPVADRPTALFMIMFHHYLNSGYDEPSVALRATQLWMLNPRRELPAEFGEELAGSARRADLAAPHHWAGFTYQGR